MRFTRIGGVRGSLRRAFADAERLGYVYRNPIALTSPPSTEDSKRRQAFTAEEVRALLDVEDRLAPVWRLAFESGCRRGELCGLRDEDIDGTRIHIRRQRLVRPTRDWEQDRVYTRERTKSGRNRTVVVSDEMAAVLWRWRAQRAQEQLALGPAYDGRRVDLRRARRLPYRAGHPVGEVQRLGAPRRCPAPRAARDAPQPCRDGVGRRRSTRRPVPPARALEHRDHRRRVRTPERGGRGRGGGDRVPSDRGEGTVGRRGE